MRYTETDPPPIGLPTARTAVPSHSGRSALRFLHTHYRVRIDRLLELLHSDHCTDWTLSDHQCTTCLHFDRLPTGARVHRMDFHRRMVQLFLLLHPLDVRRASGGSEGVRQRIPWTEPISAGATEQRDGQIEEGDGVFQLETAFEGTDRTAAL